MVKYYTGGAFTAKVRELLQDVFGALDAFIEDKYTNPQSARLIIYGMRLSDIMQSLQFPEDRILKLDMALRTFTNMHQEPSSLCYRKFP